MEKVKKNKKRRKKVKKARKRDYQEGAVLEMEDQKEFLEELSKMEDGES